MGVDISPKKDEMQREVIYHGKHSQGKINACHTSKETNNPSLPQHVATSF